MNERADPRLMRRCAGIATAALLTWGAATPMAPSAAAASVLAGLSLWLLPTPDNPAFSSARLVTARAASVSTGLIGALSLVEFLFHLDFGIDRLLLVTPPTLATADLRLHMSHIGAVLFVLLSLSLLTIDRRTLRLDWPAQFLALASIMGAA